MHQKLTLLFGLTLLAGKSALCAQTLWQGTSHGMSPAEVRKLVPEAATPLDAPPPSTDGAELLRIESSSIGGYSFRVRFFFKSDRLSKVLLTTECKQKDAAATFEKLRDLLRAKYGAEFAVHSAKAPKVLWRAARTTVTLGLVVLGFSANLGIVTIEYEANTLSDSEKL